MVRLEKMTIKSFKSFADKISIPFDSGFTVVAGPNGSGKSNISDALTFVLGISSARLIRSNKLSGLIFNGGKARSPASYAEVSIYLDNKDKAMPIDENFVKLTRRISENGVSTYKINGKSVTKRKYMDLISHANLQAEGHNIIAQGAVTKIIEMNNKERREIIDDIAGISEFDDKKRKTMEELNKVETRVREMLIVINEKEKTREKLKQEKETAEKYLELQKELKKSKASLANKKYLEAEKEWKELSGKISEKEKQFNEIESEYKSADEKIDGREKEIAKLRDEMFKKTKDFSVSKKMDEIRNNIIRKKDKIEFNEREKSRLESFMKEYSTNKAVNSILQLGRAGVHGTLSSIINTSNDYSTAIQTAMGNHSEDLVVESVDLASELINFLKRDKIGRATFIPLDKIRGRSKPNLPKDIEQESVGFAIDLVEFNPKYQKAVEHALGDTLVVRDIKTAKEIIKKFRIRIVTLDGDLVESSGVMHGGTAKRFKEKATNDYSNEISKIDDENNNLMSQISELEKQLEEMNKKQKQESKGTENLQAKIARLEKEMKEIRDSNKEFYDKRSLVQNELSQLKINRARLEAKLDNLKTEKQEYTDVKKFYDEDSDELRERIRQNLVEINKLGAVNLRAIEEYKTMNVEYTELKKKLDKLLEEKNAITKTAEDIEKRRYDKFSETLKEISDNFSRIYRDLTEGEGKIRLEEAENIDSGLVIEANPKGKKLLNLDLMSGGEKAMTALAFLFAIQQHKPAPFYILDEVDAPLDKINTKKLVNMIEKYSTDVQFVVITHNDNTIARADKVFGVSMQDGVSKLFGIKMPEES